MQQVRRVVAVTVSMFLLSAGVAQAAPMSAAGLTFSEASAGVTITGLPGTGSVSAPFILSETLTGLDATISIEGRHGFGDHERQGILGTPSPDGDRLSFAQGCATCLPFLSSVSPIVLEEIIARDYVNWGCRTA